MNTGGTDNISVIRFDTSFGSDASNDFTLPDYMPEIKRLLYVSASVLPEGKFLNGNVLSLDGTLAFNAVYVGEDGTLSSAPLVTEYTADGALPFQPESAEAIFVDTEIESTSCRATGPRGLNIKCRLRFRVVCDEEYERDDVVTDSEGETVADEGCGIERLTDEVDSLIRRRGSVTQSASGEIGAPDGAKPILCEGTLTVTSAAAEGSDVKVTGKICVRCVFAGDDGEKIGERCDIPFETSVPVGSAADFTGGRAWGRVASVSVTPDENGKFSVSVEYDLDAEAYRKTGADLCVDAYSTVCDSENEYRECEIPSVLLFGMKRFDVSGEAELKDALSGASVVHTAPPVCQASVAFSDGKAYVSGSVKVRALLTADGEVFAQEIEAPFRVELGELQGVTTQELQCFANCCAADASVRVSGNSIIADCDVCVTYSVCRRRKLRIVSSVKLGERRGQDAAPCIKVYYPEQDESVWSVCKKYRADRAGVLKNNSFDGGVAPKGKPVIIQ